jgi:hypothetical protein
MDKLINAFLADTEALLQRMEKPAQLSPTELRSIVHALKGSVSSVGADRLTALCSRVAALSDASLKADMHGVAGSLCDEFQAVSRALGEYLAKRRRRVR